jgi:hypothetical protein
MSVSIIDNLSNITQGRAEIIVSADGIEELLSAATANMVLQKAAEAGLNRPGVSSASGPYPVDGEGKTDDELLMGKRGPVAGYRRDFVILASL